MAVSKRLLAVPVRFGGVEHSGWLPANASTPPPMPVEDALVDFEVDEVEGGYILEWFSRNTGHRGDSWHETLEEALEQVSTEFGVRPEEWRSVRCDSRSVKYLEGGLGYIQLGLEQTRSIARKMAN